MLGICVIYLVPDAESACLLPLSIRQIKLHTRGDYRIYGCALRLGDDQVAHLHREGVELPELTPSPTTGRAEHAHYLDRLVDHAFAEGCSHVATFDMDSWPICEDWNGICEGLVSEHVPVASVVRAEIGDDFPFPALTYLTREFWKAGQSSFSATQRGRSADEHPRDDNRLQETGSGILAQLRQEGRTFAPLYRTNTWDPHPIMCGVYADLVFHLGAGSRAPHFVTDREEFSRNGSAVRDGYRLHVNAARREFFLAELQVRHDSFMRELVTPGATPIGDRVRGWPDSEVTSRARKRVQRGFRSGLARALHRLGSRLQS